LQAAGNTASMKTFWDCFSRNFFPLYPNDAYGYHQKKLFDTGEGMVFKLFNMILKIRAWSLAKVWLIMFCF